MLFLLFLPYLLQEPAAGPGAQPAANEEFEAKLNLSAKALSGRDFKTAAAALEEALALASNNGTLARRKPELLDRLLTIFQISGNLKGVGEVQTRRLELRKNECTPQAPAATLASCAGAERELARTKMSLNDAFGAAEMFRTAAMDFERAAAAAVNDEARARNLIDQGDALTFYAWNVARAGLQVEGQMIAKDAIQILDKVVADAKTPSGLRGEAQRIRETSRAIQAQLR